MKKFLLNIIALTLITSCEKKETPTNNDDNEIATEKIAEDSIDNQPNLSITKDLKKISLQDLENIVANKENDTIYVTNFFATWCGPCMREIPHFKEKMEELKNEPVKFTYVNLDAPKDWDTAVKSFAEKSDLGNHIVLMNGEELSPEFFSKNFEQWDGSFIPYTLIKKGDKTEEILGSTSKEDLAKRISSL